MPSQYDKPLIAVGLSFFEDATCLGTCLSSVLDDSRLRDYVKVIAIDGKYKGYPAKNDLSEDGSREIVQSFKEQYPQAVELYDFPNLHERFKRQKYVDIAASQDIPWLIILDSDEYLQINKPVTFIEELIQLEKAWEYSNIENQWMNPKVGNVFKVKGIDVDSKTGMPYHAAMLPRLWYRPQDMHYTTRHCWFKRNDEPKITGGSFEYGFQFQALQVENLVIWHDQSARDEERQKRKEYYEFEKLPGLERTIKG